MDAEGYEADKEILANCLLHIRSTIDIVYVDRSSHGCLFDDGQSLECWEDGVINEIIFAGCLVLLICADDKLGFGPFLDGRSSVRRKVWGHVGDECGCEACCCPVGFFGEGLRLNETGESLTMLAGSIVCQTAMILRERREIFSFDLFNGLKIEFQHHSKDIPGLV